MAREVDRLIIGAVALASAQAWGADSVEKFSLKVTGAFASNAAVSGELRLPASGRDRLPAVVILHSSPGFDGRGAFYAEALNGAEIATVEIDYMQGRGMPASPRHHLPHAYETLRYLAAHPRVDAARVGVMGFSWGGVVALLASSAELGERHAYRKATGRPVHILAGEKDDYEDADSCPKFVDALPPQVRRHYAYTVYPGATFGWDSRFGSAVYERSAGKGKGGIVTVVADADIANRSRQFAVTFFRKSLAVD